MPASKQPVDPSPNRLLAALPREEYMRLSSHLELVHISKNRVLYEAGDSMRYAHFLTSGMASMLAITEGEQTIEIGIVGSEGFIGDDTVLKAGFSPRRVMTQFCV